MPQVWQVNPDLRDLMARKAKGVQRDLQEIRGFKETKELPDSKVLRELVKRAKKVIKALPVLLELRELPA